MSVPYKIHLLARHLTACTVEFGSPSNGTITFGTAVDISEQGTRTFDSLTYSPRKVLTEVNNADAAIVGRQDERVDFTLTLRELPLANAVSVLAGGAATGSHARIIARYKMPGEANEKAIAVIGIIDTAPQTLQSGRNTTDLTVQADKFAPFYGLASAIPAMFTA